MLNKKLIFICISCLSFTFTLSSQNITYGTLVNRSSSEEGYTLFSPLGHLNSYLIDNCGRVINRWNSNYLPALTSYIHSDGSLYRSCRINNQTMNVSGMGGRIERCDWDGNLTWSFNYFGQNYTPHHDFCILPNGNIVLIVANKKTRTEAINSGRDSIIFNSGFNQLLTEYLVELEPLGTDSARIVWEWHVWDHLIQDFDSTKLNYGIPSQHPELAHINFTDHPDLTDWLHMNSVRYNENLDQLIVSNRHVNEVWIIDHSTTTIEAASHQGGRYGKGGDLLFRWGNPESTGNGNPTDQLFEAQHNASWIGNNQFSVYNNFPSRGYSSFEIVELLRDSSGNYLLNNNYFLPNQQEFTLNLGQNLSSGRLSSAQKLDNGNILVCSGVQGIFSEFDTSNTLVWQYKSPVSPNGIATQGTTNNSSLFSIFNCIKYSENYSGFIGSDLTPQAPIEIDYDLTNCNLNNSAEYLEKYFVNVYPNPFIDEIIVGGNFKILKIEIFDLFGNKILEEQNNNKISTELLSKGFYLIKINNEKIFKILKM